MTVMGRGSPWRGGCNPSSFPLLNLSLASRLIHLDGSVLLGKQFRSSASLVNMGKELGWSGGGLPLQTGVSALVPPKDRGGGGAASIKGLLQKPSFESWYLSHGI